MTSDNSFAKLSPSLRTFLSGCRLVVMEPGNQLRQHLLPNPCCWIGGIYLHIVCLERNGIDLHVMQFASRILVLAHLFLGRKRQATQFTCYAFPTDRRELPVHSTTLIRHAHIPTHCIASSLQVSNICANTIIAHNSPIPYVSAIEYHRYTPPHRRRRGMLLYTTSTSPYTYCHDPKYW